MTNRRFNWKIGGKAGEGISAAGFILGKTAQRMGLNVFEYGEYPSLIRGGHTTAQVAAGTMEVTCQQWLVDLMVALNEESIRLHLDEFNEATKILIDPDITKVEGKFEHLKPDQFLSAPLTKLAREATGKSLASDIVALSISCFFLGLKHEVFNQVVKDFFAKKGDEVVEENLKASEAGFNWAKTNVTTPAPEFEVTSKEQLYLGGTEATALGALSAGCQFYSAYPMTPTSNLLHFMAAKQKEYPLVVKHAEDEIAAINYAIGASWTGARSMTASAGGGFALMVESVSLAAIMEIPLVVVVGGRPGPATGLPTWTCQTDLQYVMHAGHGEFPRVVFSPGNLEECFKLTRLAFILAEKYHTQVYILNDKVLLESRMTSKMFNDEYTNPRFSFSGDNLPEDDSYRRFSVTQEGYSPRSVPGQAHGLHLTNSYEHDEYGFATEDGSLTKQMVEKRLRKWTGIAKEVPPPILLGDPDAEITLCCWGSTRMVVEEVMRQKNSSGKSVNAIHILTMLPFKVEEFKSLAAKAKKIVMIEGNALHQGAEHIYTQTGIKIDLHINRYDGRPFYAEQVIEELNKI